MDSLVLDYLHGEYGITPPAEYYSVISTWNAWRCGYWKPFHSFFESGSGGVPVRRELFRLNMAQKICEDWATLLLAEDTRIKSADEKTAAWLSGVDGTGGFIGDSMLMKRCSSLVEKAFALGTAAAIVRLENVNFADGKLLASPLGKIRIDFVDAEHIVPISVFGGKITEAAFVSRVKERGEELVYIEVHRLENDGYVITNRWLRCVDGTLEKVKLNGYPETIRTGSKKALFSVFTPNVTNTIDESCGLGMSVFAQAIDCLKGVDLAFNNFCRDLKLGGKKVFLNRSLVMRDASGNTYTPDDVAQQLFVTLGDEDLAEETLITEHNPALRTEENSDAIQSQLDYLSFRCGLGTRHYLFSGVQGKAQLTATQYTGERQDLIQNTARHRLHLEMFLTDLIKGVLWAAEHVLGASVDSSSSLSVDFDDSYFIDSESERSRDRAEVSAGLMKPYEYRMKWRGESEEYARTMTGE